MVYSAPMGSKVAMGALAPSTIAFSIAMRSSARHQRFGFLHVVRFFSAFSATRWNAACFMHWLGLLDVLRKGAAFSLRNNDAESFDLARSSIVDEGICRDEPVVITIIGFQT